MLCLPDPLAICSSLSVLVTPVSSRDGIHVGWSIWIENSHIHKAAFRPTPPKTIHHNIQPCTFLGVCCSQGKRVGVTHRLQLRFNLDLVAHLSQQTNSEVSDLIMTKGRKTTLGARQGVINRKGSTTSTVRWYPTQRPTITEGYRSVCLLQGVFVCYV